MVGTSTGADGGLRVGVSGAAGRMGSVTCRAVAADEALRLAVAIDPMYSLTGAPGVDGEEAGPQYFTDVASALEAVDIQVLVEFSIPSVVKQNVLASVRRKVPVVVGTTGLGVADLAEIERETELYGVPVLVAPNFAMGAVLMMQFARKAAEQLNACEIVELHHQDKLDAPSGTSRLTRLRVEEVWRERGLDNEVAIHSVRLPGLVAHQEVIFGAPGETLTIRHDSLSRDSFMPGVVLAVKRVRTLQGLVVGLENIL